MHSGESDRLIDENHRLTVLHEMQVLDTEPEMFFEDMVDNVRDIFKVPVAVVSFVDDHRQFLKARRGLDVCTTSRETSLCAIAMFETEGLMINDASTDARFKRNPMVREDPGISAYLGVPIVVGDHIPVGAVAAIDFMPRHWKTAERNILKRMARQLSLHLEMRVKLLKRPPKSSGSLQLVSSR